MKVRSYRAHAIHSVGFTVLWGTRCAWTRYAGGEHREWTWEAPLNCESPGVDKRAEIILDAVNLLIDRLYLRKQYDGALTTLAVVVYCSTNLYQWYPSLDG